MMILKICFLFNYLGSLFCKYVIQSPADVLGLPDESVTLTCKHSIRNYDTILWYRRAHEDTSLKLIGYVYFKNSHYEKHYEGNFTVTGNGQSSVTLQIPKARHMLHSALYFCAAFYTQCRTHPPLKTKTRPQ